MREVTFQVGSAPSDIGFELCSGFVAITCSKKRNFLVLETQFSGENSFVGYRADRIVGRSVLGVGQASF